jgi:spoIIIJ-associated protein
MSQTSQQAETFLNDIFADAKFDLHAIAKVTQESCLLDIDGEDTSLLRNEGGELLNALEHLVNQAFARTLESGERFVCDVHGFRSTRESELHAMAQHAAARVRSTGQPFTFGPMDANERRIIHLSLAEERDIQTESVGEGNARRLKVSQKIVSK